AKKEAVREERFISWPDFQAMLLGISAGKFPEEGGLSAGEILEKLRREPEKRFDWDTLNQISFAERKRGVETPGVPQTIDDWKRLFIAWIEGKKQDQNYFGKLQEVLQRLGLEEVSLENLEILLQKYYRAEDGFSQMEKFIEDLMGMENIEDKMDVIQDIAAALFGKEVSAHICAQIIDLERQIKDAIQKIGIKPNEKEVTVAIIVDEKSNYENLIEKILSIFNGKIDEKSLEKWSKDKLKVLKNTFKISNLELKTLKRKGTDIEEVIKKLIIERMAILSIKA
ncbi:MAG: KEOPS complex subunit Cgi121, partial [Candidatus Bathyarchaeia archaeon]